jgi:prevent-host-death family protein
MRTMTAAEFKAKCLKVMDEVAETGEPVVVTKRGKPVARLVPDYGATHARRPLRELFKGLIEVADPNDDLTRPAISPDEWKEIEERWVAKYDAEFGKTR